MYNYYLRDLYILCKIIKDIVIPVRYTPCTILAAFINNYY